MIQITAQMRVLVAIEPVDGRKGIDSLARLCQEKLAEDPFSGCVFVFRSRRGTSIRLLSYDGQGYWLAQKRLSKGRFVWWPEATGTTKPLEAYEPPLSDSAGANSREIHLHVSPTRGMNVSDESTSNSDTRRPAVGRRAGWRLPVLAWS